MQRDIKLFVIAKAKSPAGPPRPPETFAVDSVTTDGLLDVVNAELAKRNLRLRSVSFGPQCLIAYAEELL